MLVDRGRAEKAGGPGNAWTDAAESLQLSAAAADNGWDDLEGEALRGCYWAPGRRTWGLLEDLLSFFGRIGDGW